MDGTRIAASKTHKMITINLLTGRLLSGGRRIPLTRGQSTIVDDEDFDQLSRWEWYAAWNPRLRSYYAARKFLREDGRRTTQYMHREIMGLEPGDPRDVHHKNHDTLDNRRLNLEIVTRREHTEKRRDRSKYGSGVEAKDGRFRARAMLHGRVQHLGYFPTKESARAWRAGFLEGVECDTPEKVREAVERFLRDC